MRVIAEGVILALEVIRVWGLWRYRHSVFPLRGKGARNAERDDWGQKAPLRGRTSLGPVPALSQRTLGRVCSHDSEGALFPNALCQALN